jgi:hypothetical protein
MFRISAKASGLLFGALFCVSTMYADDLSCMVTGTPIATSPPAMPTVNAEIECAAPVVPGGDTLNSVSISIENTFSGGIAGQFNTVDFAYTFDQFNGASTLSTYVESGPDTVHNGVVADEGGITGQTPGTACSNVDFMDFTCSEVSPTDESFSITVTSSFAPPESALADGSDLISINSATYTYSPTVTPSVPEPSSLLLLLTVVLLLFHGGKRLSARHTARIGS